MEDPFLTYQERGDMLERRLRRLSTAQLRSRYHRLFGHSPRNRLGRRRTPLIHHLVLALLEPGLRLKPQPWRGPVLREVMFHIFRCFPEMPKHQIMDWIKRDCPDSRMTAQEIPWYRYQFNRLERAA